MGHEAPDQTPEGRLIEQATNASGRSVRALAANAGISDTRWRQVVRGWQENPAGKVIEARASASMLAKMAKAVVITPEQLTEVGRDDAAQELRRLRNDMQHRIDAVAATSMLSHGVDVDEIDLIYVSSTMSAREKLLRIRQVLELRAQAEREELGEGETAPAEAEAAENGESPEVPAT